MPKLIPNKSLLGVAKNVDYLVRWNLDHEQSIFKKNPEWTTFVEKLIEKEEVQDALQIVYEKVWFYTRKNKVKDKPRVGFIIGEILFQCTRLGLHRKVGSDEIYQSEEEIKILAKDIRRIKNRTVRLFRPKGDGEAYYYHLVNRTNEKDPFRNKSYPDAISDEIVMKSLDILAGAYDCMSEYLKEDRRWRAGATGIEFRFPKGKGKRKDLFEYSFIYRMKYIFVEKTGEPLSPVIAMLRNAVFTEKKPIDARRVREMLNEIDKDPDAIKLPGEFGYLA